MDEIVLSDKDKADEALKKVQMEGTDFMTVAKEVSEDQEIEKKISRGLRPEAYEKAAYALATGETSDVIEADGKYYILRASTTTMKLPQRPGRKRWSGRRGMRCFTRATRSTRRRSISRRMTACGRISR